MEKHRSAGIVSGETVIGDVEGRTVIILDDMISRGTTLARTVKACRARGAVQVYATATHGVFAADAEEVLTAAGVDKIIVTNSIPPVRLSPEFLDLRVRIISVAPLFGEAIRRIHEGRSIVELVEG
jgi:ribose-phosphate pyrophosphokinase